MRPRTAPTEMSDFHVLFRAVFGDIKLNSLTVRSYNTGTFAYSKDSGIYLSNIKLQRFDESDLSYLNISTSGRI